jgi:hypothetical protein
MTTLKKNQVIKQANSEKLVFVENSETGGARLPNTKGMYEFEEGESPFKYEKSLGKFTGNRADPKATVNFTGKLRHILLTVKAGMSPKNILKYGEMSEDYLSIVPVAKFVNYIQGEPKVYIMGNKLDEFMTAIKAVDIPEDWIDFACERSETAKGELRPAAKKAVAKAKSVPAKSKAKDNETDANVNEIASGLVDKHNKPFSDLSQAAMKAILKGCEQANIDPKVLRAEYEEIYNALNSEEPEDLMSAFGL